MFVAATLCGEWVVRRGVCTPWAAAVVSEGEEEDVCTLVGELRSSIKDQPTVLKEKTFIKTKYLYMLMFIFM